MSGYWNTSRCSSPYLAAQEIKYRGSTSYAGAVFVPASSFLGRHYTQADADRYLEKALKEPNPKMAEYFFSCAVQAEREARAGRRL